MSAAKIVTAFKAAGNSESKLSKSQDAATGKVEGYFTDLQTCVDACKADPALMGGESSAEIQYNEDVKKEKKEGGTNFTLSTTTTTTFETKKEEFGSKMVTADNIGSKLTGNSVKTALNNAGFATKSEVKSDVNESVFTLSDFSRLLSSGGLKVNAAGEVKLADTTKNTDAANIVQKMTTAKSKTNDSSIKLDNLKASTSIATAVQNVAAAAVQSSDVDTEEKCNDTDYMFWNIYGGEFKDNAYTGACEKCPDGTEFKNPEGTTVSSRCACPEPSQRVSYQDNTWQCTEAGEENDCLAQSGTYWANEKCSTCPAGTYFNEESMNNEDLPRCICEDKASTFNPSATDDKWCVVASSANDCAAKEMFWNSKEEHCEACPDHAPFDPEYGGCKCKDGDDKIFNPYEMSCRTCADSGYEYDPEHNSCHCDEGMTFDMETWKCTETE